MRRIILLLTASFCFLVACGGSDSGETADASTSDEATTATEAPATTASPETTAAPAETTAPEQAAAAAETPAGAIEMTLAEWSLTGPVELASGPQNFNVINAGSAKHNMVIVRGEGYESLPLQTNGAVIEGELAPEDIIAKTSTFDGGVSEVLSVDLAPGKYVFFCNLAFGPSSHARNGQRLDVTVTG